MPSADQEAGFALLQSIVHQAQHFVREMGAFYPFGAVLNTQGTVIPYALHAEEPVDTKAYLQQLEELLEQELQHGRINGYALGIDVRAWLNHPDNVVDAVEIRLRHPHLDAVTYYMEYRQEDGHWRFFELVQR